MMKETDLKDKVRQENFIEQHTLSESEFLKLIQEKTERAKFYSFSVKQREDRVKLED